MRLFIHHKRSIGFALAIALCLCLLIGAIDNTFSTIYTRATGPMPQYTSYAAFASYTGKHHKAPFFNKQMVSQKQWQSFVQRQLQSFSGGSGGTNIRVNQDRNPWPKLGIAAGVSPMNGRQFVVVTNDYRQNYNHLFYHVSSNGGQTWSDDALAQALDQETLAPYNYQTNPGIVFDRVGHSFISNLTGNVITDATTGYVNYDNEIDLTTGFAGGTYTSLNTSTVDYVPCNGNSYTGSVDCPGQFDQPFLAIDNIPGSPHYGTIYVYYTYICNGVPTGSGSLAPCTDGNATIPVFGSAILEAHSAGIGLPFSHANLVSGMHTNVQFSNMVIDKQGDPHLFFEDYTAFPVLKMYESSFIVNGGWKVHTPPIVTFTYNGLQNSNWQFNEAGTVAPACSIRANTAYCAFSASQIGSGPLGSTPSVYLAVVDTPEGTATVYRVNNDPLNDTKDHFFPWASVAPGGAVYVGWYDNRNDPFNSRVQYFVGKSSDGGKTFPQQRPVSDAQFNPCAAYPSCLSFGNYTQLVTGPDGVTHATWSDTRDGASAQLYTQAIT